MTCESRGTQTGCFYGLPLKLSRNLSWLFLTFSCLQQRSDVLQHIYLLQNICSLLAVVCPLLRQKTKTPFPRCTLAGYVPREIFPTSPGLAGRCLIQSHLHLSLASAPAVVPGHHGWQPRVTAALWSCNLGDEVGDGLHSVVIGTAGSCSLAATWQGYAFF